MHPSDTLVLGPLPLVGRSIRLQLGVVLVGTFVMVVLAAVAALVVADAAVVGPLRSVALRTLGSQPAGTPAAVGPLTWLRSEPLGADIVLDGQVVGRTPAEVAVAGHAVVLRRAGAPDVRVLDANSDTVVPVWARATMLPLRPPVPGGAITDLELLGDGRLVLSVASPGGPGDRQAWVLDPVRAREERVGAATREDNPPAGVVVAPDGQHRAALWRGADATANRPATADRLVLESAASQRPLLPDGVLGGGERARDLTWAPDSQSALLVTQRPIAGYAANVSLNRLRQVSLTGPPRDLLDLPVAPLEGSWVWAADGHAVAFLVRTTPPTLATLDLASGAVRSVADVPAELVPTAGAVAPSAWAADGSLVFAAPWPQDVVPSAPMPGQVTSTPRPAPAARLQVLAPDRTDPQPLAEGGALLGGPAVGPDGASLLALVGAPDGMLLVRTLDHAGHAVSEQSLGARVAGPLSVRWDVAHAQLVLTQSAPAGGIGARVLSLDDAALEAVR